jgi:hypothetical protein
MGAGYVIDGINERNAAPAAAATVKWLSTVNTARLLSYSLEDCSKRTQTLALISGQHCPWKGDIAHDDMSLFFSLTCLLDKITQVWNKRARGNANIFIYSARTPPAAAATAFKPRTLHKNLYQQHPQQKKCLVRILKGRLPGN